MMLFIWLFFGLTVFADLAVYVKADQNVLEWPKQFTVQATRFSKLNNFVETFEIWKTPKQSRIDYNNGYAKVIVDTNKNSLGVKYYIHQEATPGQGTETICNFIEGNKDQLIKPETILPGAYDFEIVGEDVIQDIKCTKFKKVIHIPDVFSQSTVWAVYNYDGWIPLRFKLLEMTSDGTTKDEFWDFYDFYFDIHSNEVFNTDEYNCTVVGSTNDAVNKQELSKESKSKKDNHVKQAAKTFKRYFERNYLDNDEHVQSKSINKNTMRRNMGEKLGHLSDKTPEEITTRIY